MTRELKKWSCGGGRRRKRFALVADVAQVFLPSAVPAGAGERRKSRRGTRLSDVRTSFLSALFWPRVEVEVVGAESLLGLETPMVFAVNEIGAYDMQILRMALPRSLRPREHQLTRALAKRRNVAVTSNEPKDGRLVGEFSTVAAELAKQHSVSIVPVGIVGSYGLADKLQLPLKRRPKVSVRFGAPVSVLGKSIEEATDQVQARVEALVGEGELSWWEVEQRRVRTGVQPMAEVPRWRRLWEQGQRRDGDGQNRIWG